MATQNDLNTLKQKLSDLDAKLKSMGGGSAQRDPRFDSAMAKQNYQNSLAGLRAKMDAGRGTPTPQSGSLGGPVGSPRSKRDPSKEIILNFAGGDFGVANDSAANKIAKKYNLEIVSKPREGSNVPNYTFKSNGNVNDIISQIKNEPGIGYAEQNFVIPAPSVGGKPQPSQRPQAGVGMGGQQGNPETQFLPGNPRSQFTQGRLMGTPTDAPLQFGRPRQVAPISSSNGLTPAQVAENIQKSLGAPVNQGPILGGNMQFPNLSKEEIENLNNPNGYWKGKDQGFLQFASPSDIQLKWNDIPQAQKEELAARYQPSPMQGAMASQYPNQQAPQASQGAQGAMATYNNLLQQGIQRSNTMNQDAASSFANLQAGAPTTQPANPAMPVAGLGMQQPRKAPAPRNFSTVNTPSARFG